MGKRVPAPSGEALLRAISSSFLLNVLCSSTPSSSFFELAANLGLPLQRFWGVIALMIGIICATFWEIRRFINDFGAEQKDADTYSLQDPNSQILLKISGMGQDKARKAAQSLLK